MATIGVTGHRFLVEVEKLEMGIDRALERIEQRFPGEPWCVVSCLAAGTDQLVIDRVLRAYSAARVCVTLPLPVEAYLKDFTGEAAQQAFLGYLRRADEVIVALAAETREQCYQASGELMLRRSQALLALWDGQPARGIGGTGEMVSLARRMALPIAWVACGNTQPGTQTPTSLRVAQGRLTLEGF